MKSLNSVKKKTMCLIKKTSSSKPVPNLLRELVKQQKHGVPPKRNE